MRHLPFAPSLVGDKSLVGLVEEVRVDAGVAGGALASETESGVGGGRGQDVLAVADIDITIEEV